MLHTTTKAYLPLSAQLPNCHAVIHASEVAGLRVSLSRAQGLGLGFRALGLGLRAICSDSGVILGILFLQGSRPKRDLLQDIHPKP